MAVPAERLPRRGIRRTVLNRRQGLTDVLRLTEGITRGELARILQNAAAQASDRIQFNLAREGVGAQVRADQLRAATRGLGELSTQMWNNIGDEIVRGIEEAADLAATHQVVRELQMGMPTPIAARYSDNLHFVARQSANDIISRRTNGFSLAERVYRNGRSTILQVGRIIDQSLAQQLSAREIAAKVRGHIDPRTPGGTSYAANRLARTEINNAHHETTIRTTENRPWVTGYSWHISGSHPRPDICDAYAHQSPYSKLNVPSKPHPQCLCYIAVEQVPRDEFLKNLKAGEYDDYLGVETLAPRTYRSLSGGSGGAPPLPTRAPEREHMLIQRQAQEKIRNAPQPSPADVEKAHAELARARTGQGRPGGTSRGGSAADRRRQRQNLYDEFGGNDRGYVPCHGCGTKMHWADPTDVKNNPAGYDRFERGKIWVKCQGGGYQLKNLLPECFACNRHRSDTLVRLEIEC